MKKVKCAWCSGEVEEKGCAKFPSLVRGREFDFYCPECIKLVAGLDKYLEARQKHDPMDDDPNRIRE